MIKSTSRNTLSNQHCWNYSLVATLAKNLVSELHCGLDKRKHKPLSISRPLSKVTKGKQSKTINKKWRSQKVSSQSHFARSIQTIIETRES